MKIIVTGGCGYKGCVLVKRLLDLGHQVCVIDAMWFGNQFVNDKPSLEILQKDIRTIDTLSEADAMIHLAAVANDPAALLDSKLTWEVNVLGTQNLLELCKLYHIPRFVYASSGSVYGVSDEPLVHEDIKLTPLSDYNKTKMIAERVVLSYKNDINVTILRPATVCGISPRQRFDVAVNALSISALRGGVMKVDGGTQIRPNVHMNDIIEAYIWCLDKLNTFGEIFNVGFENLSLTEIAERVQAVIPSSITYVPTNDPRSYRLSSQKILDAGFVPHYSIDDAIKAIAASDLVPQDINYNMRWMKQCNIK